MSLLDRVGELCTRAAGLVKDTPLVPDVASIRERLDGPLRVALAGKVKAGKSTLLNALVGEKLAPTDAGECTKLVSRYHEAIGYDVTARLHDGDERTLTFHRADNGALDIDLGGLGLGEIAHLDVGWPSSALRDLVLIDTPGLASLTEEHQVRTIDFLAPEEDRPGQADAVIYLMRHLHRRDAQFLETFTDRSLANASPVNAIAVLSRADEVGAGRLDALESAARIAARYRADARVRLLASTVLPVAGLIAETGLTLREDEFATLRTLARLDPDERDQVLVSADRFVDPDRTTVAPEIRQDLLLRLGLFGVRFSIDAIVSEEVSTGPELARALVAASGLPALQDLLRGHFMARSAGLKARTALASLRDVAARLDDHDTGRARQLGAAVEEVEARSHELAELRLVHLVLAGATRLDEAEVEEALGVTGAGSVGVRVGLGDDADAEAVQQAALEAVSRWRTRMAHPMIDPTTAEACEILARSYEGIYAELATAD